MTTENIIKLNPRALEITWSSDPSYWTYFLESTTPQDANKVEAAKLERVCWLDVKGTFEISKLKVGTEYGIFFDVELTSDAGGWDRPVNIEHDTPFGVTTMFEMKLEDLIGKGRTQISIGKMKWSWVPLGAPLATFRLFQHDNDLWKSGLIIYGVTIKPTN